MVEARNRAADRVDIRIELFGVARLTAGRRQVDLSVPRQARPAEVAAALGEACPELVDTVIRPDGSGLQRSHTLNLNGRSFLTDEMVDLNDGDTILLFSSQAGG